MSRVLKVVCGFRLWVCIGMLGMFSFGCMPEEDMTYEDTDVVSVFFDSSIFPSGEKASKYKTFTMPDTVRRILDKERPGNDIELSKEFDAAILKKAKQQMLDQGFTYVEDVKTLTGVKKEENLHLVLSVYATKTRFSYVTYPWVGQGAYNPWFPGYGYVYYPYVVNVNYKSGAVFMELADLSLDAKKAKLVWTCKVDGLISPRNGYEAPYLARVLKGMERGFALSPYLKRSK